MSPWPQGSADVCDAAVAGYWNVTVYGRKHCYRLYTKLLNEATRWSSAIQNVTDTKAPIDTPTQQLIQDIKVRRVPAPRAAGGGSWALALGVSRGHHGSGSVLFCHQTESWLILCSRLPAFRNPSRRF